MLFVLIFSVCAEAIAARNTGIGPITPEYKQGGLWLTPSEIQQIPTDNDAWRYIEDWAERSMDIVKDITWTAGGAGPSDCKTNRAMYARAIVGLRTGNQAMLNELRTELDRVEEAIDKAIDALLRPRNPRLTNAYKLPVIVIGGCHNSQFNTTLLNLIIQKPFFTHAYGYGDYVPKCFSWYLTNLENGGAIATMGNSGLGMGYHDAGYTTGLDGWLMPQFFKHYGVNNETFIGAAHSYAIADYALNFDCNSGDSDRQMLEQWPLLGDPSMLIGGYD